MLSNRSSRLFIPLIGVGLFFLPPTLFAADPVAEVLRLTPKETSLGLLVRDLRGHYHTVANGPLAEAFRATPAGKGIAAAPELLQIDEFGVKVSKILGMDLSQLRDDVFGDAVVFAYANGDPAKPQPESALLLTWARDPKIAAQMLDRLNEAQKKSGELKSVVAIKHQGQTFYHRSKQPGKGPDEYYFQRDSVVAFSQQETAIRQVIDLDRAAAPAPIVLLERYEADKAFATLWVNPRSFDAELERKLKMAEPGDAAFLQTFQQIWKATDGFAITLRLEKHLELNVNVVTRPDELPPAMRRIGV